MPSPRTIASALPVALLAALGSLVQSVNYDEYYWLAVTRNVALGERLYETMLDNKGPLWYLYPRLVDILPGSYEIGRAVVLFVTALILFLLCERILSNLSVEQSARVMLASFSVVFAVAASLFYVSVEMLGILLVAGALALAYRHALLCGLLFLMAVLVDPRLAMFGPAALFMSESRALSWRRALVIGALPTVGVLLYFIHPGLRFGVIEFGLATRPTEEVTLRAHLPILVVIWLPALVGMWRLTNRYALDWTRAGIAHIGAAILLAVISVASFTHYWTYLALTFALFAPAGERSESRSRLPLVLASLSLFPLFAYGFVGDTIRNDEQTSYLTALDSMGAGLDGSDVVLSLSFVPYQTAIFPDNVEGAGPTAYPYILETSRQHRFLADFEAGLPTADAVWVDAPEGIDSQVVKEQFAVPLQMMEQSGRFTCVRDSDPFVIFEPTDNC